MTTHYRDSLIKQSELKWEQPEVTTTDGDRVDLTIRIPLTDWFDRQAKRACSLGVIAALTFIGECLEKDKSIDNTALCQFFTELGIPELKNHLRSTEKPE